MPEAPDLSKVRLHVVTGKGGTGKTTVAAALALALTRQGKRVLLAEVEDRQGISQTFDVPPLGHTETRILHDRSGGQLWAISVDAKDSLREYLQKFYKVGKAMTVLDRFGAVDFATTIAPGVRDVLLIGKVYEAAGRRSGKGPAAPTYDAVVLDAPPTGRIAQFLGVNDELAGLARMGPIKSQADSVTRLFRSSQTACHLVTVLEEMPVQETADGIAELRRHGIPVGGVVVNQVRPRDLDQDDLTAIRANKVPKKRVAGDLTRAGLPGSGTLVTGLLNEARDHAERRALEDSQRAVVQALEVPSYELPVEQLERRQLLGLAAEVEVVLIVTE